jgi:hypothetical protein
MKKAFIVTSAIEVDVNYPVQSYFSNEERFRHTMTTIATLDLRSDSDTVIYLLDISENWNIYQEFLFYQKNLKFISIKEQFPDLYNKVITHPHKGHCECLIMSSFLREYKDELKQFDFIIKLSGRYFIDSSFDVSIFNKYNTDKIFYKEPQCFEWNDLWQYDLVDNRQEQGDNSLRQYSPIIYGWGRKHTDTFLDIFTASATMLDQPSMSHMDIETLSYYFTRPYKNDIIETDWIVYGWDGTFGHFKRY